MYYNPNIIINKLEQIIGLNYYEICHYIAEANVNLTDEEISKYIGNKYIEEMPEGIGSFKEKYQFEPYTVVYFKNYINVLKTKCNNLIKIVDGIVDRKILSDTLVKLDIVLNNQGNIQMSDVTRIVEPFVFNFNKLRDMVERANNLDTYLDFKISLDNVQKKGYSESELYPSEDLQNSHFEFEGEEGFIPYTKEQKLVLKKKEDELVMNMCDVYKNLK